jgi:1-hydroxycarotenoid 3,4-desaturase
MHRLAKAIHELAEARGAGSVLAPRCSRSRRRGRCSSVSGLADGTRLKRPICSIQRRSQGAPSTGSWVRPPADAVPKQAVSPRSLSAFVWGFAAEPKGVELAHHNVFFCADPKNRIRRHRQGTDAPRRDALYLRAGPGRGRPTRPTGPERFEIIMNGPPGHVATDEERQTCRTRTFATLEKMGLTFSTVPDDTHLTTPADFDRAFPASDGSLYGRSPHGMMATFHRPGARTKVPGLYLCGGGTHPGAGIPMACLSGKHAAAAI